MDPLVESIITSVITAFVTALVIVLLKEGVFLLNRCNCPEAANVLEQDLRVLEVHTSPKSSTSTSCAAVQVSSTLVNPASVHS